ncbi:MAG: hypothetical protein FJ147_20055 [Deltaproteobacteria bacterium]|nr:hypothetical protein [Deltaproteobacteria bacterium]
MRHVILAALLLTFVWGPQAKAQSVYPDRPMQLRITGTLLPTTSEKREDLILVDIFVQDKPWRLRIGRVEELNASGRGDPIKEDLLLRQVRFYGTDELLAQLQSGKVLTIEGSLDQKERRFRVTAVQEGGKQELK